MTINQTKSVPVSTWGGAGIKLGVAEKNVVIEYACADGEITGRLKVDARGNFRANGFHSGVRPGPVRVDAAAERQAARYEGKITGKTMTLKVTLTETNKVIGEFELKRDATTRLHRCL